MRLEIDYNCAVRREVGMHPPEVGRQRAESVEALVRFITRKKKTFASMLCLAERSHGGSPIDSFA